MKENILKAYKNEKEKIDIWFRMAVSNNNTRINKDDAVECIFHIGKAYMLAQILRVDFGEDTKKELEYMKQIKNYLQYDFFGKFGGLEVMEEKLFKYLKDFMIQNNWLDEYTPKQARAIFTTICLIGNIDTDTAACDNMLLELYNKADIESVDINYDDFESFMVELIV